MPGRTWNVCSAAPLLKARCALMESMLTTSTLEPVGRVAEAVLHPDRELHGLGCDVERERRRHVGVAGGDDAAGDVAVLRGIELRGRVDLQRDLDGRARGDGHRRGSEDGRRRLDGRTVVTGDTGDGQLEGDRLVGDVGVGHIDGRDLGARCAATRTCRPGPAWWSPALDRGQDVQATRALRANVTGNVRLRGRDEGCLELLPGPGRVRLLTMAAAPATCGVAIDVPDMAAYALAPRPPERAAEMPTPGAEISGLRLWSTAVGPRLENHAGTSSRSTAPTVSTAGAQPGAETVLFAEPLLPAAMTKRLELRRGELLRGGRHRVVAGGRRRRCCRGSWR